MRFLNRFLFSLVTSKKSFMTAWLGYGLWAKPDVSEIHCLTIVGDKSSIEYVKFMLDEKCRMIEEAQGLR